MCGLLFLDRVVDALELLGASFVFVGCREWNLFLIEYHEDIENMTRCLPTISKACY